MPRIRQQGHDRRRGQLSLAAALVEVVGVASIDLHQTIPVTTAWLVLEGTAVALVVGAVGTAAIVGLAPSHTTVAPKVVATSATASMHQAPAAATVTSKVVASSAPTLIRAESSNQVAPKAPTSSASSVPSVSGPSMARFAVDEAMPPAAPETTAASPGTTTKVGTTASRTSEESSVQPVSASASGLQVELQLIARAKSEIDRGQPQVAVAWLDEHQSRFPGGVMSAERDGLRVLMVCANATTEVARLRVAEYSVRYPGSPLLDRIRRACEKNDHE